MGVKLTKITILSSLILLLFLTGCWNTSKGTHVGYVTSVETDGLIWKTGQAYFKTSLESTQEDVYCVEYKKVYDELTKNAEQVMRVKIKYHDEFVIAPWRCSPATQAIIDDLEVITT